MGTLRSPARPPYRENGDQSSVPRAPPAHKPSYITSHTTTGTISSPRQVPEVGLFADSATFDPSSRMHCAPAETDRSSSRPLIAPDPSTDASNINILVAGMPWALSKIV